MRSVPRFRSYRAFYVYDAELRSLHDGRDWRNLAGVDDPLAFSGGSLRQFTRRPGKILKGA